jgi:sodium/bile acid cotransporter 7
MSKFAVKEKIKRLGIDAFVIALVCAVVVAYLFPFVGTVTKPVSLSLITDIGISGIFFFYGIQTSWKKMYQDLHHWKIHLTIQTTTFLLFPLLILPLMFIVKDAASNPLWMGVFYVAALPSTVSSSVLMVSMARGNVPSAIFNASFSSILGIVLTPLWMRLFLSPVGNIISGFGDILLKLVFQIILPLFIGFALHRFLALFAEKQKKYLRLFERMVIVLIVYNAFANAFAKHLFFDYGISLIIGILIGMATLLVVIYLIVWLICRLWHFSTEDTITTTFCGSKKSLVHGSAMVKLLFKNIPQAPVLIPIMMYHIMQLIIVSIIATRYAQRKQDL